MAAMLLAKKKKKVALFERKLSIGGGMWGGGMMFNEVVVQEEGKRILQALGIRHRAYQKGYYTADSIETVSTLCSQAMRAGARIFNLMSVEDVMVREGRVTGVVLNWTAVEMANLHVDPLCVAAKYVVDATGHATEVIKVIERKVGGPPFHPDRRGGGRKIPVGRGGRDRPWRTRARSIPACWWRACRPMPLSATIAWARYSAACCCREKRWPI